MDFKLEESLRGASDEELLQDLRRSADSIGRTTITMGEYSQVGKTHPSTIQRRFGSWTKALQLAGLQPSRSRIGIPNDELFENLRSLWSSLGRQPRDGEVKQPNSKYAAGTYENRFGSWTKTLQAFVTWVNLDVADDRKENAPSDPKLAQPLNTKLKVRRTRREISDRQRFRILLRDGFTCRACGASPIRQPGVELHVDHIIPWSKGGETTDDNLQTKCAKCNLGKGNAFVG